MADPRQRGIRTITDLTDWDERELQALAKETSHTEAPSVETKAAVPGSLGLSVKLGREGSNLQPSG